jgi:hypothetical protein
MPVWSQVLGPLLVALWVGLLLASQRTVETGLTPLVLLPIVWVALYCRPREAVVVVIAVVGVLELDSVIKHDPASVIEQRAVLWGMLSAVLVTSAYALRRRLAARSPNVRRRFVRLSCSVPRRASLTPVGIPTRSSPSPAASLPRSRPIGGGVVAWKLLPPRRRARPGRGAVRPGRRQRQPGLAASRASVAARGRAHGQTHARPTRPRPARTDGAGNGPLCRANPRRTGADRERWRFLRRARARDPRGGDLGRAALALCRRGTTV